MSETSPFPIPVSALKPVSCGSVLWRSTGALRATFVVKISLGLVHERTAWPTTPHELVLEDRRSAGNPLSSLVETSEMAPYMPNAAVILFAHACAPQGRPTPAVSARFALFRDRSLIDKTVHVFGERKANAPQQPRPFERVALVYERAWGGATNEDNPVGISTGGAVLPSICDPTNPTKAVGFGPISRQWPQRRRYLAGNDAPRLDGPLVDIPSGFDFRYYNPAPPDQQIEYLQGDEWLVLDGMHPTMPRVQSRLPQMRGKACVYFVTTNSVSHNQVVDLVPDMLVIDAGKLVASVVFRGSLPLDSIDMLPRLRVFADVELPGNPTRWPESAEVLRAPATPPFSAATNSSTSAPSSAIFATQPAREDSASRSALPFQPKPLGARTVVPFVTAPPVRPRMEQGDIDPLMRTTADLDESSLRAAVPFVASSSAAAPPSSRSTPPPAMPRRPADDEDATRAIDIEQLEAKRAAVTPFDEGSSRPVSFDKPESKRFAPKSFDSDESTRAIDIEQLTAKRAAVTPFAAGESAKPAPVSSPIPGSPWANPRVASPPQPPSVRPPAYNIEDPLTQSVSDVDVEALPFAPRAASPSTPPPPVAAPSSARVEPPALIKPPPRVEPPPRIEPPPVASAGAFQPPPLVPIVPKDPTPPAVVSASAPPPPPPLVPVVPKDPAPPSAPSLEAPPASVSPEEPLASSVPSPSVSSPPSVAPTAPVADETGVRATVIERLRSGVPAPLHGLSVVGADLSGLDMHGSNLSGHDLGGVKFSKTNLSGARLGGARLVDADLEGADLSNADLAGADLTRAMLTNARMPGVNIDNACFSSAQGPGAIFDGAKGRATLFVRGQWPNASFRKIDILSADFTGAALDGAIFDGAVLPDIKLNDARGAGAKFDGARLDQVRADGSALTKCSFHEVDAKGSSWENATLDGSSFENARMENAVFVRTSCREVKFVNANLRAANFGRAQGDASDLGGANLDGADFRQARFVDARFEEARMPNVLAPRADFSRSNFKRADMSSGSLRAAQLGGANLAHAILDGADLRDADLKRSVLFKASRTGTKLSGANTKDAIENDPTE